MSSTTITRGNSHETFYITPSFTPTSVTTSGSSQTFALPGLQTTDNVQVLGPYQGAQTAGVEVANAYCSSAGNVTIQFIATTTATPASGQYLLQIVRTEGNTLPTTAV